MKEIVIIGGGIGGLSAGIRSLQRGFAATLVEKEPRVGGYAISFTRGGYTFDLALHVVPSGGDGDEFSYMAKNLGLDLNFIRLADGFNVYLDDYHFLMPNGYEDLFQKLEFHFPEEKKGLQLFRADLEKYVTKYAPLFDYRVPLSRSFFPFLPKVAIFLRHSSLPTDAYLKSFFADDRLRAILFQPAAFMGIPMREFPTVNFMMMFYLLMKGGMYTIEGGGEKLTSEMEKKFIELGGRLIKGVAAEKIHLQGKKANGVSLSSGALLQCDAIIAGNNLFDVVNTLIGRSHFTPRYLENLRNLEPSLTVLVLNLGLDCSPQEIGIRSHISMIFPDADIDGCFTRQSFAGKVEGFSVTAHGLSDPGFGGLHRNSISIVAGTSPDWLALVGDAYRDKKEEVGQQMIEAAERYFPGLQSHIVVRNLATPKTMRRYSANPGGAIMGMSCTAGSHRSLIDAAKLPISNVVMGSAWTNRLGGFMQSMKSGILAAEKV